VVVGEGSDPVRPGARAAEAEALTDTHPAVPGVRRGAGSARAVAVAKPLTHEGKTSWWRGTFTTLCGITVPTKQTENKWWSSTPTCPVCLAKKKR